MFLFIITRLESKSHQRKSRYHGWQWLRGDCRQQAVQHCFSPSHVYIGTTPCVIQAVYDIDMVFTYFRAEQRRHIVSFSCSPASKSTRLVCHKIIISDGLQTMWRHDHVACIFFAAMLASNQHLQCSFLLLGAHIIQAVQHCNWFCSTKFTSFRPFSTEKVLHLAAAC